MTTTTDYSPPAHMAPDTMGFHVATKLYMEATRAWEATGRSMDHDDPDFVAVTMVILAIAGMHDGWLEVDELVGASSADVEPIVMAAAWPDPETTPEYTAPAYQWVKWRADLSDRMRATAGDHRTEVDR